jgi:hypothetical protein
VRFKDSIQNRGASTSEQSGGNASGLKQWLVQRHGSKLGTFIAEKLQWRGDTLCALRGGRIIGSVAAGPGLTWEVTPWPWNLTSTAQPHSPRPRSFK